MAFYNYTCFYKEYYECSIVSGGGLMIVIVSALVAALCICRCIKQRKKRRSRDITGSSAGKPASNDYKITSLHTDITDDYRVGSGATDTMASNNSMRDFHNISLRVPNSIHEDSEAHGGSAGIPLTNIRSIPKDPPAGKGSQNANNSERIKGHSYDDVLPTDSSTSVDTSSAACKAAPYSVAMAHTLVLSNMDTRGQLRSGHTYHLLDGSNPNEKATVVAVGSKAHSTSFSKDNNSFRKKLGSSRLFKKHEDGNNRQSRRTTLSSMPSKSGLFDDPNYANTSITVPASVRSKATSDTNGNQQQESAAAATAQTRSMSLVQKPDEKPPLQQQSKLAVETESTKKQKQPQPASTMFDDPMYDVGMNLTKN